MGVIDGCAFAYELFDRVGDIPDVDVHAGHDTIADHPEGDELPRRGIAAEDNPVPRAGEARVLHADLVLVGEEVRHALVGGRLAKHAAGSDRPLVESVGPVLDADPLAVEGVLAFFRRINFIINKEGLVDEGLYLIMKSDDAKYAFRFVKSSGEILYGRFNFQTLEYVWEALR